MKTTLAIVRTGQVAKADVFELRTATSSKPSYAMVCEFHSSIIDSTFTHNAYNDMISAHGVIVLMLIADGGWMGCC